MDGEREAQSLDFDAALALHLDTLTRELAIQVRKVYRSCAFHSTRRRSSTRLPAYSLGFLKPEGTTIRCAAPSRLGRTKRRCADSPTDSVNSFANATASTVQYESSYASEAAFDLLIEYCATSQAPEAAPRPGRGSPSRGRPPSRKGAGRHPSTVFQRGRIRNDRGYFAISEAAARGVVCRGLKQLGSRVRAAVACST